MLLAFVLVRSQTTDKGNEDNEDEDYQPVENQKITYLDDSNFEEITHVCNSFISFKIEFLTQT